MTKAALVARLKKEYAAEDGEPLSTEPGALDEVR